jgi:transposase
LGIDEFRGNTNKTKYHCILTDIESGLPVDILSNRTEASLIQHFRKYQYTQQLKNVEIIVIDMWLPYFTVLREIFPQATIVIDRFHMVRQAMWGTGRRSQADSEADAGHPADVFQKKPNDSVETIGPTDRQRSCG